MLSVLTRNKDFRRLYFSQLIVFGADWFVMVPLLILLNDLTHKGIWGGLVLSVETGVVALLLPYAGTIADRFDRKHILITTNLAALLAVGGLFFVRGPAAGPVALLAVASLAVAKAFYSPASSSAVPNMVDPPDLSNAMAVAGTTWGTMTIVGSSVGGLLTAWLSPYFCFGIVGFALISSALLTWGIKRPMQEMVGPQSRPAFAAIKEGLLYLQGQPRLRALITVKSAVGLGNGVLTVFPILAIAWGVDEVGLGIMFAARGLGALVGPLLFRKVLNRPDWLLPGLALSMSAYGLFYVGVAFSPWFFLALVGIFFAHLAGGGNWVMSSFAIQQAVPDELRGRVNAADTMVAMLAVTASQFIVGLFVDSVSATLLITLCGLTTLCYAIGWRLVTRRLSDSPPTPALATN
ncbi:MFS transporter [Catelliglobosispora koreensis]|uniref:MFS transporter n=1 Tax=Catelliglobosispora koreensis TaxID=129052 RepID=UPI000371341B|nr:MFS transporter [Catelliglobosispora koreensis]